MWQPPATPSSPDHAHPSTGGDANVGTDEAKPADLSTRTTSQKGREMLPRSGAETVSTVGVTEDRTIEPDSTDHPSPSNSNEEHESPTEVGLTASVDAAVCQQRQFGHEDIGKPFTDKNWAPETTDLLVKGEAEATCVKDPECETFTCRRFASEPFANVTSSYDVKPTSILASVMTSDQVGFRQGLDSKTDEYSHDPKPSHIQFQNSLEIQSDSTRSSLDNITLENSRLRSRENGLRLIANPLPKRDDVIKRHPEEDGNVASRREELVTGDGAGGSLGCRNTTSSGSSRRVPLCSRCRNHGLKNELRGHKGLCNFKDCECARCVLVRERQAIMARQVALTRVQQQQERAGKVLLTPPVNTAAATATAAAEQPADDSASSDGQTHTEASVTEARTLSPSPASSGEVAPALLWVADVCRLHPQVFSLIYIIFRESRSASEALAWFRNLIQRSMEKRAIWQPWNPA